MKRANRILACLRHVNSISANRSPTTRSLHHQVSLYSHLSPCFPSSLLKQTHSFDYLHVHQQLYFSTKPNSVVELVLTNEWSKELEHELEKNPIPVLTHEAVSYVLKKFDKNPQRAYDFFNWVCNKNGFNPSSLIYSIILRILGRKHSTEDFWDVIKNMSEKSYDLDRETYVTLMSNFGAAKMSKDAAKLTEFWKKMNQQSSTATVKGATRVILGSNWNNDLEMKLLELNLLLSENIMLKIFRELWKYPLKAFEFFHWVEEHLGYKHNAVTYNAIVRVLRQKESIDEFWRVLKEMKRAGHDLDMDSYIKLSRNFQKAKMFEEWVELYEFIMDSPYKPSVEDCSAILHHISMANAPDLSLVFRVVQKYEATGNSLSKEIYHGIHRSLTAAGRFDEAKKITETMRNAGYQHDNITSSQLIFGLCKAERLDEAFNILDEMEAEGCVPDLKTWTILIRGYCILGEVEKALKCFEKMLDKNIDPDAYLLRVLVCGMCSKKMVVNAYTLVISMLDKVDLRTERDMYTDLIRELLEERKLEEAINLLCLMEKHGIAPFLEPFVDCLLKSGKEDDATEFLKALSIEKPSASTYLDVFKSFFKEGRKPEAQDLL